MLRLNVIISREAPSVRNSLWLKPVDGGFTLYALFNGKWQTMKLVDDAETPKVSDDAVKTTLKVTDITVLTTKQCNSLNVGDQVIKKTGSQRHLYTVTYKEDKQGLCLSYFDAENAETVAYQYDTTNKVWDYLDTTITPLT